MKERTKTRMAALLLSAALLPALCACGPVIDPNYGLGAETPPPIETAPVKTSAVWTGGYDATEELLDTLGVDLTPWLRAPALAAVTLEIDPAGRCSLRCDYAACAEPLQRALTAALRELCGQERDETPEGEVSALAAGTVDELLPPPLLLQGTLSGDGGEIRWGFGRVSALRYEEDALLLDIPGLGSASLTRTEG